MKINIDTKQVTHLTDFRHMNGSLMAYQMYFHQLENGNFNARTVTPQTNTEWLKSQIRVGRIYLPQEGIQVENN